MLRWAQSGWTRLRGLVGGEVEILQCRYAEVQGDMYHVTYDTTNAPLNGSSHNYKCDLNTATGTWTFSEDDVQWQAFQDDFWKTNVGNYVNWAGEIANKQDDMPGKPTDKCDFTGCQYRLVGGAYQNAGLVPADVGLQPDDPKLWGAQWVSSTAFSIWDKHPR